MIYVLYQVILFIGVGITLVRGPKPITAHRWTHVFLLWNFGINFALGGIVGAIAHTFFASQTARAIGWPTSNPFQFEVAMTNLGIGLVSLLCLKYHGLFWWATALIATVFLEGDAVGHIVQVVQFHNHHPDNSGPVLYVDILLPIVTLVVLFIHDRAARTEAPGEVQASTPASILGGRP